MRPSDAYSARSLHGGLRCHPVSGEHPTPLCPGDPLSLGCSQGSFEGLTTDGRSGGSPSLPGASGTPATGGSRSPSTTSPRLTVPLPACGRPSGALGHRGVRSVVAAGITGLRGCHAGGQQRVASQWPTGYLCSSSRGPAGVRHRLGLCVSAIQLCACAVQLCECVQYCCV